MCAWLEIKIGESQLLARMPAFGFFLIGNLAAWYTRPYSCVHYVESWLGVEAIFIALTSTAVALSYLARPVSDNENAWMLNVGHKRL